MQTNTEDQLKAPCDVKSVVSLDKIALRAVKGSSLDKNVSSPTDDDGAIPRAATFASKEHYRQSKGTRHSASKQSKKSAKRVEKKKQKYRKMISSSKMDSSISSESENDTEPQDGSSDGNSEECSTKKCEGVQAEQNEMVPDAPNEAEYKIGKPSQDDTSEDASNESSFNFSLNKLGGSREGFFSRSKSKYLETLSCLEGIERTAKLRRAVASLSFRQCRELSKTSLQGRTSPLSRSSPSSGRSNRRESIQRAFTKLGKSMSQLDRIGNKSPTAAAIHVPLRLSVTKPVPLTRVGSRLSSTKLVAVAAAAGCPLRSFENLNAELGSPK
ncbi:expressed unknown protein [Seminavis robusta]|uniref:Uncharacterized protein n=1 Tax=Seminavis robusta TaxID=568900 RepID=A0A9N8E446_9STRA|nr:expressed unknown protein [Seminavis robusta]|eukprot:Sro635_g179180.1 n/a (328) ;mRNA; r:46757-47740